MARRLLDCGSSDYAKMSKEELLWAIGASEGRTLACETIGAVTPLLGDVTNAELAAALGADILLLNLLDVEYPRVQGLPPTAPEDTIRAVKRLTGRPVGINLEPVEEGYANRMETPWTMTPGRLATAANAEKAADMGVDLILLTGNPGTGVTNKAITDSLKLFRQTVGERVILAAGKMHASGVIEEGGEQVITAEDVDAFLDAGADILLLPAPGTVPGLTQEYIRSLISRIHARGKLALTSIGTSQEGADKETVKQIALMCKMVGADLHHLGDSGYMGIAAPENITAYSVAIKGVRHTYRRMARSLAR